MNQVLETIRKPVFTKNGKFAHLQLPVEWIREQKIRSCDYVRISTEKDGSLRLKAIKE